ncbi:MAG: ABC transporter ATP-binding protein [Bacteroidales bacterium]|jgi:lipopolysaccharide transport system ATP-binding protein|nr:ABC transporter ATP-binding protein [Bacteroidales bacterium]
MTTAIRIENLSKQYRLGTIGTGTLSHDLNRWWTMNVRRKEDPFLTVGEVNDRAQKATSQYVWALKDINLEIEQGDIVGIIGKNGSGKSTLLKILSRVTKPTTGNISYKGRIASLLEVGTGFHPEMTGRENIYMNGAIMGMTKREITQKLDEIVAFAGVERYIDTPVKRYSSGMTVRLGFAIAAHLEPEILVVDEVLAVGDAEFQKKAIGKMQDVSRGEGRTVLFVSHNMGAVQNLCKTGVLLNNGRVDFRGTIENTIDYYLETTTADKITHRKIDNSMRVKGQTLTVQFVSVQYAKQENYFASDEPIEFLFEITAHSDVEQCRINTTVLTISDVAIGSVSNRDFFSIQKGETKQVKFTLVNHNLALGEYQVSFSLGTGNLLTGQTDFDIIPKILSFSITQFTNEENLAFTQWHRNWGNISFQSKTEMIQ